MDTPAPADQDAHATTDMADRAAQLDQDAQARQHAQVLTAMLAAEDAVAQAVQAMASQAMAAPAPN